MTSTTEEIKNLTEEEKNIYKKFMSFVYENNISKQRKLKLLELVKNSILNKKEVKQNEF